MQVFNAGQQLLIDQPGAFVQPKPPVAQPPQAQPVKPQPAAPTAEAPAPKPAEPEAPKAPQDKDSDTLWIHDDLDLDSLDLDEELAKLEQQEQQLTQEFLSLEQAPRSTERLLGAPDTGRDPHDETWAEALLRQENAHEPVAPEPPPAAPATPAEPIIETDDKRREPSLDDLDDTQDIDAADDDLRLSAAREEDDTPPAEEPSFSALPPLGAAGRGAAPLRDDSLADLTDEPLQLDWQPPKSPWGRWIAWGLLNLVALFALGGQYVAYHFDELARQDRYRPWFEQICPEIGCTLPSKVDITLIKSSNLVVRSHPEFSGALVVDAILYNRAPFSQPFPLLEIRFADLNGQLLASRRFKPSEYLAGELAGQTEMPPQTPIHISLDILDPGAKAVNYSLSFHSPE